MSTNIIQEAIKASVQHERTEHLVWDTVDIYEALLAGCKDSEETSEGVLFWGADETGNEWEILLVGESYYEEGEDVPEWYSEYSDEVQEAFKISMQKNSVVELPYSQSTSRELRDFYCNRDAVYRSMTGADQWQIKLVPAADGSFGFLST